MPPAGVIWRRRRRSGERACRRSVVTTSEWPHLSAALLHRVVLVVLVALFLDGLDHRRREDVADGHPPRGPHRAEQIERDPSRSPGRLTRTASPAPTPALVARRTDLVVL